MKDKVFAEKKACVTPFKFNAQVAEVFDDMLFRSVPFYGENLLQQARLAEKFYQKGTRIYDLGCSHGNLGLMVLDTFGDRHFVMTAVDSSVPMIDKYRQRLEKRRVSQTIDLVCRPMEEVAIENASVVLINLTLQFLDPARRDELIRDIYQGMAPGGILLLTEKTVHPLPVLNDLEQAFYRQFKRENGYSELEISQKRDALEKVLVPESILDHEARIRRAGFSWFTVWLKWFNFASMMAVK